MVSEIEYSLISSQNKLYLSKFKLDLNSAFSLLQYTFIKKLKLQTGVRYDNKSISTQAVGSPADPMTYRAENLLFLRKAFAAVYTTTAFDRMNASPDETTTSGYTLLDLSLGGNIKIQSQLMSVSISANNLFDRKYIDHLSTLKEVGLFNPGRNIALNLRIPFAVMKNGKKNIP